MITWTKVRTLLSVGEVCKKEKVKPVNSEILCRKQGLDSGADSGFFNGGGQCVSSM